MRELFLSLVDLVLPPRRSELLVRDLTAPQLHGLAGEEPLPYSDPRVVALIWELKYYGSRRAARLSGEFLSEQILEIAAEELGKLLLIPVPMHKKRRRARGHNQTELLCRAALPFLSGAVEYLPKCLHRAVDTPTQQGLPRKQRLENVRNSMEADPSMVAGRVCIVVDDVVTTGATLEEAKRALLHSGARAVHCVALARS